MVAHEDRDVRVPALWPVTRPSAVCLQSFHQCYVKRILRHSVRARAG